MPNATTTTTTTTTTDAVPETALACRRAAGKIGCGLAELRRLLLSQEHRLTATSPAEFQALVTSFDIYAHMLDDALADFAAGPCRHPRGDVSLSAHPEGEAPPDRWPLADRGQPVSPLEEGAAAVIGELCSLKRRLESLPDACCGALRTVKDEWDIATDGLLGSTGVLGHLARVMNVGWVSHRAAIWGGPPRESTHP